MAVTSPLRIGVVGGGLAAQAAHLPSLAAMPGRFSLAALVEPDAALAATLCRRHGIERHYPELADLLASNSVEAVVLTSPNATHAPQVRAALEAGLHVLVEKPMCISLADADEIVAAQRRSGRVVQVGYMKRFDEAYEALLADVPRASAIQHIEVLTYDPRFVRFFDEGEIVAARPPDADAADRLAALEHEQVRAAFGRDVGGPQAEAAFSSVFLGALVHDVNVVHGVLEAAGHAEPVDVVDAWWGRGRGGGGTARLANGATWTTTWLDLPGAHEFQERIAVYADDGVRELRLIAPYSSLRTQASVYRRSGGQDARQIAHEVRALSSSFARELAHFHDCVRQGAPCRTPPEQARKDIELLTRMFACARDTRPGASPAEPLAAGTGRS